jgi:hypothetical protein
VKAVSVLNLSPKERKVLSRWCEKSDIVEKIGRNLYAPSSIEYTVHDIARYMMIVCGRTFNYKVKELK